MDPPDPYKHTEPNTYLYLNVEIWLFVIELKITKVYVFVFEIWSVFEKYLQIQSNKKKSNKS